MYLQDTTSLHISAFLTLHQSYTLWNFLHNPRPSSEVLAPMSFDTLSILFSVDPRDLLFTSPLIGSLHHDDAHPRTRTESWSGPPKSRSITHDFMERSAQTLVSTANNPVQVNFLPRLPPNQWRRSTSIITLWSLTSVSLTSSLHYPLASLGSYVIHPLVTREPIISTSSFAPYSTLGRGPPLDEPAAVLAAFRALLAPCSLSAICSIQCSAGILRPSSRSVCPKSENLDQTPSSDCSTSPGVPASLHSFLPLHRLMLKATNPWIQFPADTWPCPSAGYPTHPTASPSHLAMKSWSHVLHGFRGTNRGQYSHKCFASAVLHSVRLYHLARDTLELLQDPSF